MTKKMAHKRSLMAVLVILVVTIFAVGAKKNSQKQKINITNENVEINPYIEFEKQENKQSVHNATEIINKALRKYPANFEKKIKLKKIYIVKNITSKQDPVAIYNAYATAFYNSNDNHEYSNIYFDSDLIEESTVHHEIWHAIEYANSFDDQTWGQINKHANYIGYDAKNVFETQKHPGFVDSQSYFNSSEDRATLFSFVQTQQNDSIAIAKYSADNFLKKKAKMQKEFLGIVFDTNAFEKNYDTIFENTKFATVQSQVFFLKANKKARIGTTNQYPFAQTNSQHMLYKVETISDSKPLFALIDEAGNLVFAFEEDLNEVTLDFTLIKKEIERETKAQITTSFEKNNFYQPALKRHNVSFAKIDFKSDDEQQQEFATLSAAKLFEFKEVLFKNAKAIAPKIINEIVVVTNLRERGERKPAFYDENNKVLYIDVQTCKKQDLLNLVKA